MPRQAQPVVRCAGVKANGLVCGAKVRRDLLAQGRITCAHHHGQEARIREAMAQAVPANPPAPVPVAPAVIVPVPPPANPNQCVHVRNGVRCTHRITRANALNFCTLHFNANRVQIMNEAAAVARIEASNNIAAGQPWTQAIRPLRQVYLNGTIDRRHYLNQRRLFAQQHNIQDILRDPANIDRQNLIDDWINHRNGVHNLFDLLGEENAWVVIDTINHTTAAQRPIVFANLQEQINAGALDAEVVMVVPAPVPPPQPRVQPPRAARDPAHNELRNLAQDRQNVHTTAVTNQTNKGMEKILKANIPSDQETLAEIFAAWTTEKCYFENGKITTRGIANLANVINDVTEWYIKKTCRANNDRLYQRCLRGAWAMVKAHKERKELTKRLYEECLDAYKMCCEGHLTRIVNVFTGYDEDVKVDVPVGEILQQKISVIATKDIPVAERIAEATALFNELNVPEAERMVWIEAIEAY